MRPTPLQTVTQSFESRAALVTKLSEMVDKQRGDTTADQVKARLMGLSNQKLLRLYKVEQKVREHFGDRSKLVEHLVSERRKAGMTADESFKVHLSTLSAARLLDLSRVKHAPAAQKKTPAEKLKSKRGRQQRERAQNASSKSS